MSPKLDLYLNALGLLSPSLVEGFGIPVLDGACLGMPTLASDCESTLKSTQMTRRARTLLRHPRQPRLGSSATGGCGQQQLANQPAKTRQERIAAIAVPDSIHQSTAKDLHSILS